MRNLERGAVYGGTFGEDIVGYRCSECGRVFESMMGDVCRACRRMEERHAELITAAQQRGKGEG